LVITIKIVIFVAYNRTNIIIKMKKTIFSITYAVLTAVAVAVLSALALCACSQNPRQEEDAYLFSYFQNDVEDAGLFLAYSFDGLKWTALNNNQPILKPTVGEDKLMRDPSICQAPDGTFHMVWTSSWHDQIIGYASSKDLINWSEQKAIPVMMHEPQALNSWAPELFYDAPSETYYIFWATTIPGAEGVNTEGCLSEDNYNHRIYCTTTKDFEVFTPTRMFFNPDFNAIDAAIAKDPETGELIMVVKDEGLNPVKKDIHVTRTMNIADGFPLEESAPISPAWCEGPAPLFVGSDLIVYFDRYTKHQYGASISHDHGYTWEDISDKIEMPEHMSHGTAFTVKKSVVDELIKKL